MLSVYVWNIIYFCCIVHTVLPRQVLQGANKMKLHCVIYNGMYHNNLELSLLLNVCLEICDVNMSINIRGSNVLGCYHYITDASSIVFVCYVAYGSGHETVAVLLPGFAIN